MNINIAGYIHKRRFRCFALVIGLLSMALTACGGGAAGGSGPATANSTTLAPGTTLAPTLSLSASPTTVASGGSTTLTWSSTNASSCTASGGWSGSKSTAGTQTLSNLTATATYSLACTGAGGSASQSATVTVTAATPPPAPAPTLSLSASPTTVASGGSTTLTWSSTNASSCTASGGWSGSKSTAGTQTLSNLTATATYSLACTGAGGSASQSATITVTTTTTTTPLPCGSGITCFTLTSPTTQTSVPFTVGLAFKKGDVPGTPALDIPDQQVIVKKRWNDGSVKHAIASGHFSLSANTPKVINVLNSSGASAGTSLTAADIQAASPQASVQLGSIGTVNLSSLLGTPFRTWISGPEMVEAHYRSRVGNDSTLAVWFHVRLYKGGQVWIRASVENGYLDLSTSDKSYVPTVTIGGAVVYNNGGAALTHYAHTRWTAEGWIGSDPKIAPKLDTSYLINTKLVPNYWKRNPSAAALNNLYQTYSPMQNGGWTPNMGDTGFQNQIGLLPLWDALYVNSGADARSYRSVIANAKALNSYPIVWTGSVDNLPARPSAYPTWSVYGNNQGGGTGYGAGSLSWDVAHHGSGGYLAYLITGDYFYLETMQDQSAMCYLINGAGHGSGTSRLMEGQTRATAWCQRTIGQLVGIAPPDSVTSDYQALLANNAAHWQNISQQPGQNPLGYLYSYELESGGYGTGVASPWQEHFWVQTYGLVSDIEPFSDMSTWNAVRDYLYKAPVGILGPVGTDNYCYTKASNYTLTISSNNSSDSTTWYSSWGLVYQNTFGALNTSCGNTLEGSSGGDPASASQGYWGNLMPAIAYAVDHGAPGASAAWTRLTGASNWSSVSNSGFDDVPIWGIVPR